MRFASVRIITGDIIRLVDFYEQALGLEPRWRAAQFAEFPGPSCLLAIGSAETMALFGAPAAVPGSNRTAILEFLVGDVDAEYRRLSGLATAPEIVQPPATMPWGNRSLLLRDPDGNLVNFFTPPAEPGRA
ncbi:VOC family protein [Nocardia spumae]|uniref:VOC family protein n=1 Tax=Nocardia spumae TaxID=2887190 RepID=UPI001D141089|nr:VOC family protein [Nocardia spumae]